jgi:hypothetical protein
VVRVSVGSCGQGAGEREPLDRGVVLERLDQFEELVFVQVVVSDERRSGVHHRGTRSGAERDIADVLTVLFAVCFESGLEVRGVGSKEVR